MLRPARFGKLRQLLIVQRNELAARSLARHLSEEFDAVTFAHSPEEAEAVLSDPARSPTHVVCGLNFGSGAPSGSELIPRWREAYPTLACVVLATGQGDLPEALDGIDGIYLKPSSPTLLARMLARA
jgi:DNA-binding NarL/FixJ family response regulator